MLTVLTVPLVVVGLKPASVIVAPTKNGWTVCAVYAKVAVPALTVNAVAVSVAVELALVCAVVH